MLRRPSLPHRLIGVALLVGAMPAGAWVPVSVERPAADPLAAGVARWGEALREPAASEEIQQIRSSMAPRIADAERALAADLRWVALARLALVWGDLEAANYGGRIELPAELAGQMAVLESEWRRLEPELSPAAAGSRPALEALPAAARAFAEAALGQVPVYHAASLDYGRNTAPEYGLFYLGSALGQLDLARWIASLPARPATVRPLAPRDLAFEIDAAENEAAAAYVPPRSIESHAVFIRINALLKEAHELAAAGSRFGALQRLLDARARLARLLHPGRSLTAEEAKSRGEVAARALAGSGADDSLQRLFLELAIFSATDAETAAGGGGEVAAAIFEDVLPRFPEFLGPAPKRPPERKAEASVTLVRWPYT